MYYLESSQLRLSVHGPADGFYQGTRFDRSGVLDSLQLGGKEICNHRIACLEPYNFFSSTPESPFSWRVQYELFKNT